MIPIIGPIIAALGGALGIGAGGAAATGLGSLLGNAWLPALGTGIGTLLTGGSGKDALRNAAIAGGGSMLFPGMGKSVSGGIAQLMGIGGTQLSGPTDMGMAAGYGSRDNPYRNGSAGVITDAPARGIADAPARGADIQERRRSTVPGISALSNIPRDPRLNLGIYSPSYLPLDPRLGDLSPISEMSNLRNFDMRNTIREYPDFLDRDFGPSEAGSYTDPYTGIKYARREARDAAMYNPPETNLRTPVDLGFRKKPYATGGEIQGPGTGTSDSVPATIYQGGKPVKDAALSDGEFVMTAKAVRGMGNGSRERGVTRMYELMRRFENGEMT